VVPEYLAYADRLFEVFEIFGRDVMAALPLGFKIELIVIDIFTPNRQVKWCVGMHKKHTSIKKVC
jgi:hypothetical protein